MQLKRFKKKITVKTHLANEYNRLNKNHFTSRTAILNLLVTVDPFSYIFFLFTDPFMYFLSFCRPLGFKAELLIFFRMLNTGYINNRDI